MDAIPVKWKTGATAAADDEPCEWVARLDDGNVVYLYLVIEAD